MHLPLMAALLVAAAVTANVGPAPNDWAVAILKVHNTERAAVGTPPLVWDNDLAEHAAAWAAHLDQLGTLQHSANTDRPGEGENLWMGSAGGYSPTEMAQGWANEKRYFKYGAFPNVSKGGNWQVVGHYTQMIWKSTTKLGCAIAHGKKWDILVCRYSLPGNFMGEKPY